MKQVYHAVPREDGGWKIVVEMLPREPERAGNIVPSLDPDQVDIHTPPPIRPSTNPTAQPPHSEG
ncbi:MAG: hypothetical protein J4G05_01685 [Chlorobi bacterium]|nr:hypothetical protein [Chlorobiota bacterium]